MDRGSNGSIRKPTQSVQVDGDVSLRYAGQENHKGLSLEFVLITDEPPL
jgi:hypothetical protein